MQYEHFCILAMPPFDYRFYDPGLELLWEEQTKQAHVLVSRTAESLRAHGMIATTSVQQGDSKSTIVNASEEWRADLIVMGRVGEKPTAVS
jgi:nucleotide-binding universal stress UspA family protein